jgi:hypothetical protein
MSTSRVAWFFLPLVFTGVSLMYSPVACSATGPETPIPSVFETVKFVLSVIGYLGALTAFFVGLAQYRRADYWKRAEFLANDLKDFFSDRQVSTALMLMDWRARYVDLGVKAADAKASHRGDETLVDRDLQCSALRLHTILSSSGASDSETHLSIVPAAHGNIAQSVPSSNASGTNAPTTGGAAFSREEAAVRDCYDKWLDGMNRYGNYLSGELVSVDDLAGGGIHPPRRESQSSEELPRGDSMRGHTHISALSKRARKRTLVFGIACLTLLSACAHLEKFSNEATEFNIQVADAQNKTLLLNIVRAANRFPMHFTELSTLSGTGTATLGGSLTIPVGVLNGGSGTGNVIPMASVTETPTFNVAVLETQEFYNGMLKAISTEELSTYLQEGLEPELVLSLGIGTLLFRPTLNAEAKPVLNDFHPLNADYESICPEQFADSKLHANKPADPTNPQASQYACFKSLLQAMLGRGLTTESIKSAMNIGGLITQNAFNDLKWVNGLDPKVLKVTSVDAKACAKKADACPEGLDPNEGLSKDLADRLANHERLYRVQKESNEYRYCFNEAPERDDPKYWRTRQAPAGSTGLAARIAVAHIPAGLICHDRVPDDFKASDDPQPDAKCDPKIDARKCQPVKPPIVKGGGKSFTFQLGLEDAFTLEVQPRSTEGVIYYLGEITRCNSDLDKHSVCTKPTIRVTYRGTPNDETLFAVTRQKKPILHMSAENENGEIKADWADYRYAIKMDPTGMDRSGQVLRVLTQLLALNRSAKDFPTPSIVPIISH